MYVCVQVGSPYVCACVYEDVYMCVQYICAHMYLRLCKCARDIVHVCPVGLVLRAHGAGTLSGSAEAVCQSGCWEDGDEH